MSGATRRSARNLQKLATQNSNDLNENIYKRDYSLNANKAMKGKLKACETEYKVKATNRGGNQIIEFSAAMYELYRTSLVKHFEALQNTDLANMKVEYRDITDKTGLCVESLIKVSVRDDLTPKYTINLYHTKSKVMVNGREVNLFNIEHLKITDYILSNENVNSLDQELRACIIDGLKTIEDSCTQNKSCKPKGTPNQLQITHIDTEIKDAEKSDHVRHNSENSCIDVKPGEEDQAVICPACDTGVEQGICCDLCLRWFHFDCETLSDTDIEKLHDTDLQYFCISSTYDKQCAVLNDSILYTQSGVTEAGEETYPKTLDLDICPINPQNSLLSPSASSNDITETNVKMIDLSSHVASSKTNSIQRTDALNSVASGSKHPNDRLSQNAYGPKYDKISEQPNGTGSLGVDTTEGVVTENCSDELVNRHHTSAKSLRVPTNECTNLSQYDSEQESITKTLDVDSTDLKQTQDTTSSGAVKTSGGGTNPKAGKQTSRQNKKSDKSKLKEGKQEEQLKLARSLISNLERKVVELENSNRILRQDLIAPSSSSNNQNNVNTHTPPSNIAMSKDSDVKVQVPPRTLENDIRNMKEHLNCLELEQMKARILNIENHIQTQTRLNAMQTPGHMGLPYTNPYVVGGNGQWQGGPVILGQNSHIPFPYPFHGPYQVPQTPIYPNVCPPNLIHVSPVGLNIQGHFAPQIPKGQIIGQPMFYGPLPPNPNLQMPGLRVQTHHNHHRPGQGGQSRHTGSLRDNGTGHHHKSGGQHWRKEENIQPRQPEVPFGDEKLDYIEIQETTDDAENTQLSNLTNSEPTRAVTFETTDGMKHEVDVHGRMSTLHTLSINELQRTPARENGTPEEDPNPIRQLPEAEQSRKDKCQREDRKQEPFLGAGRASEQTAKRRSL